MDNGYWDSKVRIKAHPILGDSKPRNRVSFTYDGRELSGFDGEPILIALRAAGVRVHRYTGKHRPRGVFCAIGRCTDCVMVVDGRPNVRTCVTALRDGMTVETQVGAGAKRPEENGPEQ